MAGVHRGACIDCGTNTFKMIIADLSEEKAERVYEISQTTRIGEGMQSHGMRLQEAPMLRALDALELFTEKAKEFDAEDVVAVGTAALRDAQNQEEFLHRARQRCGVEIKVIPGEEEARLSFLAVRLDPHWRSLSPLLVIDIGGGSTELIQGELQGDQIAGRISINQGAVKLTESCLTSDPPTPEQLKKAQQTATEAFGPVKWLDRQDAEGAPAYHPVGVGGTLTTLGAMSREGIISSESLHGLSLQQDVLDRLIEKLSVQTVEERIQLPGLDARRADIILGGAIILSHALTKIGSERIDVSTRGLRWGVLYDRFL